MCKVESLSDVEREALAPWRFAEWGDGISLTDFSERNRRLYHHPFGKKHVRTFGLRNEEGKIVSSCDLVSVPVWKKDGRTELATRTELLASVVTPRAFRGRGYAKQLLDQVFDLSPTDSGILYSDIGLGYYERWGFQATPTFAVTETASKAGPNDYHPLTLGSLFERMNSHRLKLLLDSHPALSFRAEGEWMDWRLECFRAMASAEDQAFPRELAWETPEGSFLVVPVFHKRMLYVFWKENLAVIPRIQRLAFELGFEKIYYWDEKATQGEIKYPMAQGQKLIDVQYADWW